MQTRNEKIKKFLSELDTEVDVVGCIGNVEVNSYSDVLEQIEACNGFDQEIIYYDVAIKYLQENDVSLQESLNLAHEMGYTCDNVNSELLASLLDTQKCRDSFYELETEITDFFEELDDDDQD